jgi:hypothetical protein
MVGGRPIWGLLADRIVVDRVFIRGGIRVHIVGRDLGWIAPPPYRSSEAAMLSGLRYCRLADMWTKCTAHPRRLRSLCRRPGGQMRRGGRKRRGTRGSSRHWRMRLGHRTRRHGDRGDAESNGRNRARDYHVHLGPREPGVSGSSCCPQKATLGRAVPWAGVIGDRADLDGMPASQFLPISPLGAIAPFIGLLIDPRQASDRTVGAVDKCKCFGAV